MISIYIYIIYDKNIYMYIYICVCDIYINFFKAHITQRQVLYITVTP